MGHREAPVRKILRSVSPYRPIGTVLCRGIVFLGETLTKLLNTDFVGGLADDS